jgi:hypothetical protein
MIDVQFRTMKQTDIPSAMGGLGQTKAMTGRLDANREIFEPLESDIANGCV